MRSNLIFVGHFSGSFSKLAEKRFIAASDAVILAGFAAYCCVLVFERWQAKDEATTTFKQVGSDHGNLDANVTSII